MRNGGILHIKLSWIDPSGVPIVLTDGRINLCDLFADFHDPCTWKPGTHHISYNNQTWPDVFPTVSNDCAWIEFYNSFTG